MESNCQQCGKPSANGFTYSGPSKEARHLVMCKTHKLELFEKMKPLLAAGMGTWTEDAG